MGYPQKKNENTDEEVKDFLWNMMEVEINDADLDRTLGLPSKIKSYKRAVNAPPPTDHRQVYQPQSEEFCLLFEKKVTWNKLPNHEIFDTHQS